jgi:hypothetical protein
LIDSLSNFLFSGFFTLKRISFLEILTNVNALEDRHSKGAQDFAAGTEAAKILHALFNAGGAVAPIDVLPSIRSNNVSSCMGRYRALFSSMQITTQFVIPANSAFPVSSFV